jgi:TatA/E family protein of Tat protein translocase
VKNVAFIGWPELILILAILIFIFGASRLRGLAKALGESVKVFKETTESPETKKEEKEGEKDAIIKAAKKMGVETEGRGMEEILNDMTKMAAKEKQ